MGIEFEAICIYQYTLTRPFASKIIFAGSFQNNIEKAQKQFWQELRELSDDAISADITPKLVSLFGNIMYFEAHEWTATRRFTLTG